MCAKWEGPSAPAALRHGRPQFLSRSAESRLVFQVPFLHLHLRSYYSSAPSVILQSLIRQKLPNNSEVSRFILSQLTKKRWRNLLLCFASPSSHQPKSWTWQPSINRDCFHLETSQLLYSQKPLTLVNSPLANAYQLWFHCN